MKQKKVDTQIIGSPTETGDTEGGRRPTGESPVSEREKLTIIDPQVHVLPKRRKLSKEFKRSAVAKVIELRKKGFGAVGSYLRSIGLYYSSIKNWERQLSTGTLDKKSGCKAQSREVLITEVKRLRRKLESVQQQLLQSELIIDLQKKISDIAGLSLHKNYERSK
jgi:transposase